MGGKKDEVLRPHQMKAGYHIASISYPLVNEGALQPAMLNSALRAVQFLRFKAKDWKIDPDRIVATGGSAGGCSSLLIALHDDIANPKLGSRGEVFIKNCGCTGSGCTNHHESLRDQGTDWREYLWQSYALQTIRSGDG